jgi:predicted RNase H-like nuclease
MFGYKLIKKEELETLKVEIENLKSALKEVNCAIDEKVKENEKMITKINEQEKIIANLTQSKFNNENNTEKPVKKVRRKCTKKTIKKED